MSLWFWVVWDWMNYLWKSEWLKCVTGHCKSSMVQGLNFLINIIYEWSLRVMKGSLELKILELNCTNSGIGNLRFNLVSSVKTEWSLNGFLYDLARTVQISGSKDISPPKADNSLRKKNSINQKKIFNLVPYINKIQGL